MSDEKKGAVLTGEELDEIAALVSAATEAPWHADCYEGQSHDGAHRFSVCFDQAIRSDGHMCVATVYDKRSEIAAGELAELIARLRNAAPALLESARLARIAAELFREHGEAMVRALQTYYLRENAPQQALSSTIAAFRKGAE